MAKTPSSDAPETPVSDATPAASAPEPPAPDVAAAEPEQPGPGTYEYTRSSGCVYPHVPLTCHPEDPGVAASEADPGRPARPATVFDWPDGPPTDGRWTKTRKKANQLPDNVPASSGKE